MNKLTKKQWARIRQGVYAVSSASLKVAGVYGIIEDDKSQVLLLLISAVLDLAFAKVDVPTGDLGREKVTL